MVLRNILLFITIVALASCVKEQTLRPKEVVTTKKKIAEVTLDGSSIKMAVYADYDSLFVGYNPLHFALTDTVAKKEITDATISVMPVMDMMTMKHSCPVDQPEYVSNDKMYNGAAAFIMATDGMMGWTITTTVTISGKEYKKVLPVTVKNTPSYIKLIASVKDQNNVPHFLVLVHPQKPEQKVGMNDLEVAVYKKSTMMSFPAVDGMSLSFIPTMPSMGHDSPNNVNPVSIGKGHYKGKVNFSMTGDWRLDFTLSGNGSTFSEHAFLDILF